MPPYLARPPITPQSLRNHLPAPFTIANAHARYAVVGLVGGLVVRLLEVGAEFH